MTQGALLPGTLCFLDDVQTMYAHLTCVDDLDQPRAFSGPYLVLATLHEGGMMRCLLVTNRGLGWVHWPTDMNIVKKDTWSRRQHS